MKADKIRISILIIYAIYLNPIVIGGVQTICYLLIYGIALGYIIFHSNYIINKYLRNINIKIVLPIFWILFSLMLSVIIPFFHGTNDYSYVNVILAIFRKIIIIIFLFLITARRHKQNSLVDYFMLYYSFASILYIASTVFFALFSSARSFWQEFLQLSSNTLSILSSFGYINRFGWAGFAGFRNTIDCTLSLIFLIYLYSDTNDKIKIKTSSFVILVFICFLGNMFYGRSGVIASSICLVVGLILYKKLKPKLVLSVVSVVIIGIIAIVFLRRQIPAIDDWYKWVSTPFYNLITKGSFNNYSANRLLNEMIFMPSRKTLLFGDGRYTDVGTGLYYMSTDAGFMRQVLFWGAGLTGIMYLCWLYCLCTMKKDNIIKLMLLIMCILFEIKGEVYYELLPLFLIISMIDLKKFRALENTVK